MRSLLLLMILAASIVQPTRAQDRAFEALAADYIDQLLQMNPEYATLMGDHRFDHRLNDYSPEGWQRNLGRELNFRERLAAIDTAQLSEANRIDYEILKSVIESSIFSMEELREHEWNPLIYNLGGSIYALLARDFAPLPERLRSVKARLEAIPNALEQAKGSLKNPPRIHTETAIQQNEGTISLVRDELDAFLDQAPGMSEEIAPAQDAAVAALEAFGEWMNEELLSRSNREVRLGESMYRAKLTHTLHSDLSMEEVLERAWKAVEETHQEMYETALPLYRELKPDAPADSLENRKHVIRTVLDALAEDHPTDESVVEQARRDLAETTEFVRQNALVTVPDEPVEVIVMPEFQRGVAIAYCDSPGPLEENGETFFAIAPTPEDWSAERKESFFREYNDYMLKDLTVHEAMPGHYLQLAHSNAYEAPTLIRSIFWSGPFVEGWAVYSEQVMAEHGYGGPEVRMQQLKMKLRATINAILDQSIHAGNMTEQEAMDLMMNEGFQEEGEAAGKWRRALLTSTQLSVYFVGYSEMVDIREAYEAKHGPITDWRAYHDTLLSFGSPPAKYVRRAMGL